MKKNKFHIVYVPMTGVGLLGSRGDEWLRERIRIFKKYTFPSIQGADMIWLSFREEDQNNPLIQEELWGVCKTFHGLMYWDDKFTTGIWNRFLNTLRIIRRCWRYNLWAELLPSLKQLALDKNSTLERRIDLSLPKISINGVTFPCTKADWIYFTRIDSDDMLAYNAIEEIQKVEPFEGAITMGNGYIYNTNTQEMAEWNPQTNPPFHTIIFPKDVFFDAKKHLKYYNGFKSHEDIPRIFKTKSLGDDLYCVTVHNPKNHISTFFDHPFRGQMVNNKIIERFGITLDKPK